MMKKLLSSVLLLVAIISNAQETQTEMDSTKHWSIQGQNTLNMNQASFSNWISGGANNIGWMAGINYNLTYEKDKNLLENIIILGYGQNNTDGIGNRKTQDVINISSNYGRRLSKNWYASVGAGILTQFDKGFADGNNPLAPKISNFMAPGFVNTGAGFTFKPNDNFTATLRPANARWTFVLDKDLQKAGNFGLKNNGDSSLFQFGFFGSALYNLKIMENINLINSATVFSNYLENPDHLVLGYAGVLNMKINKYISTQITLDLLYDHNQIKRTQLKQTLGVGFAYNIDNGVKRSDNKINQNWK